MWVLRVLRLLLDTAGMVAIASLLSGWLVQTAPGGESDSRTADPGYSAESLAALKAERNAARAGLGRSAEWFLRAAQGDFGRSEISGLPVADLLSERIPVTARTVGTGALGGFVLALAAATVRNLGRRAARARSALRTARTRLRVSASAC
jgi:peptide/nickel transport system permease protein